VAFRLLEPAGRQALAMSDGGRRPSLSPLSPEPKSVWLSSRYGGADTRIIPVENRGRKSGLWLRFLFKDRDGFGLTERHRSRTCLASGYDAVLVLKTSWGTGPGRSAAETS